jgi:serine/threonine protein kinase
MLAGYLPFDDPNMNALFNKIERGEYRMARHFSDSAKDLIGKMMTVNPKQRISIEGVIDHPWFQVGFDPKAFQVSTKLTLSKKDEDNAIENVDDPKKGQSSGKEPALSKVTSVPTPKPGTSDGCDVFDLISRLTSGSLNPLIAAQHGTTLMRSSTRFLFKGNPNDVLDALEALKGNPKKKEGTTEIKGFFNAPKGLLTYLTIVIPTCAPNLSLVELRRGRGDIFDFHEMYHQIQATLGSKVRSAEVSQLPDAKA